MASCGIEIRTVQSPEESRQFHELLWEVLWKPIGLPRDIRASLEMKSQKFELVALQDSVVVGGLVAFRLSDSEIELRYIAIRPDCQRRSIGTRLVGELIAMADVDSTATIRTHARNTALGFWDKLGFRPASDEWLEYPDFAAHGIKFRVMEYTVTRS